jgi:hypothetical protein
MSQRLALGLLFLLLSFALFGIGLAAASAGGRAWVVALAAVSLGVWLAGLAARLLHRR